MKECGMFLPINPFDVVETTETRIAGSGQWEKWADPGHIVTNTGGGEYWYAHTPYLIELPPISYEDSETAVTQAAGRVASATWDVATFAAEAHKTHEMVAHRLRSINRIAERIAHRARKSAKSPAEAYKRFSQYWLEGRFGWRPAVSDCENAAQALSETNIYNALIRKSGLVERPDTISRTLVIPSATETTYIDETLEVSYKYRGKCYGKVFEPRLARFGMNPAGVLWELQPYSFVADWVVDIGGYIKSLTPILTGIDIIGVSSSFRMQVVRRQQIQWQWDVDPTTFGGFFGIETKVEINQYTRNPTTVPLVPHINLRMNAGKWTDLAALAAQGISRVTKILGPLQPLGSGRGGKGWTDGFSHR
jgi:hypothetical protein